MASAQPRGQSQWEIHNQSRRAVGLHLEVVIALMYGVRVPVNTLSKDQGLLPTLNYIFSFVISKILKDL